MTNGDCRDSGALFGGQAAVAEVFEELDDAEEEDGAPEVGGEDVGGPVGAGVDALQAHEDDHCRAEALDGEAECARADDLAGVEDEAPEEDRAEDVAAGEREPFGVAGYVDE